ncbi:tetratricopeptide repeat protein, partial [Salinicola aestuarinus]|uniref:tetratricopeptide repeat protein n=1 Tax=Salinicola aestuarinus TaxID=1949082 RepID=UPI00165EF276
MTLAKKYLYILLFLSCFFLKMTFSDVYYNDPTQDSLWEEYGYNLSLKEMEEGVGQGSARYEYLLGELYINGSEVFLISPDYEKALELLESSWEGSGVDAGYSLFKIYYDGLGVEVNYDAAFQYLKESAEMGYTLSQRSLGDAYGGYKYNEIAEKDYGKALFWYQRAIDQGDQFSARALAQLYHEGKGVEQSDEEAFKWLLRSGQLKYGDPADSFQMLAKLYEEGVGTDI